MKRFLFQAYLDLINYLKWNSYTLLYKEDEMLDHLRQYIHNAEKNLIYPSLRYLDW